MQFTVSRDALLKPLQLVSGVVERRQTLPVLSNILLVLKNDQLSLTGTDLEVELIGNINVEPGGESRSAGSDDDHDRAVGAQAGRRHRTGDPQVEPRRHAEQ